jgi:hypothetical protein
MDNAFSDKLLTIFQNVNDWLKFAEAKNAALLAFSGTGMTATLTVLATGQNIARSIQVGLLISTILLGICALLSALSFLPKTDLEKLLWKQSRPSGKLLPQPTDNLYYFGDLQKYKKLDLLNVLNEQYFNKKITMPYGKEHEDLANQIIINSEIGFEKTLLDMLFWRTLLLTGSKQRWFIISMELLVLKILTRRSEIL